MSKELEYALELSEDENGDVIPCIDPWSLSFSYPKLDIVDNGKDFHFPVNYDRLRELLEKYPERAQELAFMGNALDLKTGLVKEDYDQDNMQDYMEWQLLEVVDLVASFGLSGSVAPIFYSALMPLLDKKNIKPLTGADWEWIDVSSMSNEPEGTTFQNRRFSSIFKKGKDGEAFWLYGKQFSDDGGRTWCFRGKQSHTPITFPCVTRLLQTEYILDVPEEETNESA